MGETVNVFSCLCIRSVSNVSSNDKPMHMIEL
jgi:hypothetical protein